MSGALPRHNLGPDAEPDRPPQALPDGSNRPFCRGCGLPFTPARTECASCGQKYGQGLARLCAGCQHAAGEHLRTVDVERQRIERRQACLL